MTFLNELILKKHHPHIQFESDWYEEYEKPSQRIDNKGVKNNSTKYLK